MIRINDKSRDGIYSSNMELIDNFTDYSSKNLDFDKPVEIDFLDDEENAKNPLGSTAHYNPDEMKITIYVTGRHLKDILRSISHELIHHVQNCRGDLDHGENKLGYAQDDKHMRGMEHEAYTMGNIMNFRDFEDNYKITGANRMSENKINKLRTVVKKVINEEINLLQEQSEKDVVNKIAQRVQKLAELKVEIDGRKVKRPTPADAAKAEKIVLEISHLLPRIEAGPGFTRAVGAVDVQAGTPLMAAVMLSPAPQHLKNLINTIVGNRMQTPKAAPTPAPTPSPTPAGRGKRRSKRRSKRCPSKTTFAIQKKLNALGYKLNPTRKAQDGVDGIFGGDTYEKLEQALGKKVGRNRFVASRNCKKLLGLLQKAKSAQAPAPAPTPTPAPSPSPTPATPTPSSGLDDELLFQIRMIADRQVQDALSRSAALRNVEAKNINIIRVKYREPIVKNVAQQFINKKLEDKTQIQDAVKKLVFALEKAKTMDKEAANFAQKAAKANEPKAAKTNDPNAVQTNEGIEINFDEFTKTLNEHKNNKFDDKFKKLVKAFKK